ncbi:hypothetical protein T265_12145 [Opisthorchis viverrini]|uniref:Uncharacterized protein n=1 Tax=Opisthorchis viverrini TaxID=6198 RepID=A0A074YVL4_OPIVI|nr:hypothetical protein T265_12145 [Opisthorchis viverrini]KER18811.1 hypothetical protein T265_12145 [Opisthorchis viverrini]
MGLLNGIQFDNGFHGFRVQNTNRKSLIRQCLIGAQFLHGTKRLALFVLRHSAFITFLAVQDAVVRSVGICSINKENKDEDDDNDDGGEDGVE